MPCCAVPGAILMMGVPFIGAPNAAIYASKTEPTMRGEFMSYLKSTDGTSRKRAQFAAENLERFARGKSLLGQVVSRDL